MKCSNEGLYFRYHTPDVAPRVVNSVQNLFCSFCATTLQADLDCLRKYANGNPNLQHAGLLERVLEGGISRAELSQDERNTLARAEAKTQLRKLYNDPCVRPGSEPKTPSKRKPWSPEQHVKFAAAMRKRFPNRKERTKPGNVYSLGANAAFSPSAANSYLQVVREEEERNPQPVLPNEQPVLFPKKTYAEPSKSGPCVYQLLNVDDNTAYIGSSEDVSRRWGWHIHDAFTNRSKYPQHTAMRKHGITAFRFSILELCTGVETVEELESREMWHLAQRINAGLPVYNQKLTRRYALSGDSYDRDNPFITATRVLSQPNIQFSPDILAGKLEPKEVKSRAKQRHISFDEIRMMKVLKAEGFDRFQIARLVGITPQRVSEQTGCSAPKQSAAEPRIKHPSGRKAKLTLEQSTEVQRLHMTGMTNRAIAVMFGVSSTTIAKYLRNGHPRSCSSLSPTVKSSS